MYAICHFNDRGFINDERRIDLRIFHVYGLLFNIVNVIQAEALINVWMFLDHISSFA